MNVKTAGRTLDFFEAFANVREPMNLSDLAKTLEMPMSSCFALVHTLESRGYVYKLKLRSGIYPTKRLLKVAQIVAAHDPILDRVEPILSALQDAAGETVLFSKRQGDQMIYLDVFESHQSIRYNARVGEFKTLHASCCGKALLGAISIEEFDKILSRLKLPRFTAATITSRKALKAEVAMSRQRGWYSNTSESVSDLIGLAVPVSLDGEIYIISLAGPVQRMSPKVDAHVKALQKARLAMEAGK